MDGKFFDAIGVIGSLLVLFGFYRTSIGRWTNRSLWYELDNVIGALLIAAYQIHMHTYISVILNFIWAIVAFRGLTNFTERYLDFHRVKRAVQNTVIDTKHAVQETVEEIVRDR